MCLGPDGFGECGYMSLWAVASRNPTKDINVIASLFAPEPDKICLGSSSRGWFSSLRRVGVSKCNSGKTKNLGFTDLSVQGDSGMLLSQGKNCLARGQGRLRNSADMQPCKTGTSLALVQASIHVAGLQIRTADDYCFDGSKFRVCNDGDPTMRWGVGFDFRSKEPSRNLFFFFDQEKCAVREGEKAKKGDCKHKGARNWGWREGRLTQGKKHCLGRAADNSAIMVPCSEGYEFVTMVTPDIVPTATVSRSGRRGPSLKRVCVPPRPMMMPTAVGTSNPRRFEPLDEFRVSTIFVRSVVYRCRQCVQRAPELFCQTLLFLNIARLRLRRCSPLIFPHRRPVPNPKRSPCPASPK
ncbi:unnamed protein product, partial [Scytosiphon promiscuus]